MESTGSTSSQSSSSVPNVPDPDHSEQSSHPTLRVAPEPEHAGNSSYKRQKRCLAWPHYTMMKKEDGATDRTDKAICNYCGTSISCDSRRNGTSGLTKHLKKVCKKFPLCEKIPLREKRDKRQRTLAFQKTEDGLQLVPFESNQDKRQRILDFKNG